MAARTLGRGLYRGFIEAHFVGGASGGKSKHTCVCVCVCIDVK